MSQSATAGAADATRLEAFSDAVFGFALTLLVVSLEVPKSFDALVETMSGFPAFAVCFAVVVWIWYEHRTYFADYGQWDKTTVTLNAVLLFVVLFYVYPLKFVFTIVIRDLTGLGPAGGAALQISQLPALMAIYSVGFVVLFGTFALLYRHAARAGGARAFTALERFDMETNQRAHLLTAAVGVVSIALALTLPARLAGVSGWMYGVLGPLHALYGRRRGRQRQGAAGGGG